MNSCGPRPHVPNCTTVRKVVLYVLRYPPVPGPEQREDIALDRVVLDDPDRLKGLLHREFLHHCVSLSVLILSAADDCDKS